MTPYDVKTASYGLQLATASPTPLFLFGVFLLLGVIGGVVAHRVRWIPTITAFMLLGMLAGPSGLGLITKPMLNDSMVLVDIALGLILYRLGNMLHPQAILRSAKLMSASAVEALGTFLLVTLVTTAAGYSMLVAAIVGAIAVSSSPAVLVHVAEEMNAKGPMTERAKALVALNNIWSFLLFSMLVPFAIKQRGAYDAAVVLFPVYQLVIAGAFGFLVAWLAVTVTKRMMREEMHYRFALVAGSVMLCLGLSEMANASLLFAPLVLGMAVRWFETSKHNLSRVDIGEGGDLFFIILFVMAGAKLDLASLAGVGPAIIAIVAARMLGKCLGIFPAIFHSGFSSAQSVSLALMLIPMAGMAIGLTITTGSILPEISTQVSTIIFAMVAIFETAGPFAVSRAILIAGESNDEDPDAEVTEAKA